MCFLVRSPEPNVVVFIILSLVLSTMTVICFLWIFLLHLLIVYWASYICELSFFWIKKKLLSNFQILPSIQVSLSHLLFLDSNYTYVRPSDYGPYLHNALFFILHSFLLSVLCFAYFSTGLCLTSLTLSSIVSSHVWFIF